jgi:tetratricopeptide (TPR) repeat protein
LKFEAGFDYAKALKSDQKTNEALGVLNEMLKNFSTHRDLPFVKLEIADCAKQQGRIESAIKQYTAIIENHQRTDASAAAYFALGEIYERHTGDFAKAKENYDNVRRESARSEKLAEAERRSKAIDSLTKLKEKVATLEKQRAALARGANTPLLADNKSQKPDVEKRTISRIPRRALNVDAKTLAAASNTAAKDPQQVAAELAKSKILLAELYLFNFNRPDSAMREYLDVFEFFPQTEYAPQAMYSLAYILGDAPATLAMRDSILQVLAVKYGSTPQGQGAKRRLHRADTLDAAQTAPELFRQAEENLIKQKDPQRAVQLYQEFLQSHPDSKYAPQSLYAMGWIYEHELSDNTQALAAYKKLIETYPDSPMARRVRTKVTVAEQPAKPDSADSSNIALPPSPETEKQAASEVDDDTALSLRRNNQQPPPLDDATKKPPADQNKKDENKKDEAQDDKKEPPEPPRY